MSGKGGGKSESAQASGTNLSSLKDILKQAIKFANTKLGIVDETVSKINDNKLYSNEIVEEEICIKKTAYLLGGEEATLKFNKGNLRSYRGQIAAKFSDKKLNLDIKDNKEEEGGNSELILTDKAGLVKLRDSNAIAYYLSNDRLKGDNNILLESEIIQWLNYADNHVYPSVISWILPIINDKSISSTIIGKENSCKLAKEDCLKTLNILNNLFINKTYLVGENITLADITLFTTLIPLYEYVLDKDTRKRYRNLNRWFMTILNQPEVKNVIKEFQLCDKSIVTIKKSSLD